MNTRGVPDSSESTAVPLPEAMRAEIYRNAGASEIYGKTIHKMLELGINKRYNVLFDNLYGNGAISFNAATEELVLGVDKGRGGLIKPIAQHAEHGSTFTTEVDDQWPKRSGKVGFFGGCELGFACIDSRILTGLVW